jgi:TM2 domain-containing membrane protein YozV
MKTFLLGVTLILAAAVAWAYPPSDAVYLPAEIQAIEGELGTQTLGNLKVSDSIAVMKRLDVAREKDQYLSDMAMASFWWPGAGQFATGNLTDGVLHTGVHLGLTVGTVVLANAVLPSDVRLGNLDYFGTNFTTIHNTWSNHTLSDYLPTIGVVLGGTLVDLALRAWSAKDARQLAREQIDEGRITFEPRFDFDRHGFGMGIGMRY